MLKSFPRAKLDVKVFNFDGDIAARAEKNEVLSAFAAPKAR